MNGNRLRFCTAHCRGRQLGDPLPTQHSVPLNGKILWFLSSWLPPGGSCHDEISASRNRYFVVTDEGWRWLKVIDCPVKWYKPKQMPLIQLHLFTNLSPPLIRLFYQPVPKCRLIKNPASPRGKPRGSCGSRFHSTFCSVPSANGRLRRTGRQVGDLYNGCTKLETHTTCTTLPQSARSG